MKHIPNMLSIFRIVLIPFFIREMFIGDTYFSALILLASGLTDLLDGYLARKFGWISQLGKVLDPIADKLTIVTVCIVLMLRLQEYKFYFIVLLLKECIMLVLGANLIKKKIKLEGAKWFGKLSTFSFYFTTILLVFIPLPTWLANILLSVTTLCAVSAAFQYLPEYSKYKKELKKVLLEEE